MIPKECKRLAEVDFPIALVSKYASAEKEARCGHIPKLHIWPAARPTGACRAVLLGLLLPDPCDPKCPDAFKTEARQLLSRTSGKVGKTDLELRKAILAFIGTFANWGAATDRTHLDIGRGLVRAAFPDETPLVVDPFAGGGAIPLESLRLGCEAVASDLNPVASLIQKVVLEDIPRHGLALIDDLREIEASVKVTVGKELADLYPADPDKARPITYLWARTVQCESPNCGAEIPLIRSLWLTKKANRRMALQPKVTRAKGKVPKVEWELFVPTLDAQVCKGTVSRAKATCLCCNNVLPPDRVRAQLREQRGGADAIFDKNGNRIGGARLLAVVTLRAGEPGRSYRLPTDRDYKMVWKAAERLKDRQKEKLQGGLNPIPNEPTPAGGGSGASRAFSAQRYGMMIWSDLFTVRQKIALSTFSTALDAATGTPRPSRRIAALCLSKMVDMNNNLATWQPHAEIPAHMLTRFAIPMKWDFAEAVPISESSGTLTSSVSRTIEPFPNLTIIANPGTVSIADATEISLPDQSAAVYFTDPPYYDAVPYSDISDFFFVWLKRTLPADPTLRDPFSPENDLTPKSREIVQDETRLFNKHPKDRAFFEERMCKAFSEGRRVLQEDGIGAVVFAHKTTEGWEALLSGIVNAGWTISGSWPVATEMGSRLRARDSAALATSVHLVCRPRPEDAMTGDWGAVLRELPRRVGEWMERLQSEGVRGADLVFACIGPALEIFSRYERVETAEGKEIKLDQYLQKVWEVVGRTALEQVLGTAEAKARNGAAGVLEEDARLTALFLWTLQSTAGTSNGEVQANEGEEEEAEEDEEEDAPRKKSKGFTLVYDVVRRFAQPLGIHLPDWEHRIIETKKGTVRLLPVGERAMQLFGEDGAEAVAERIENNPRKGEAVQLSLFPDEPPVVKPRKGGRKKGGSSVTDESLQARREATTLDRVHAAMLLQASGRANALRALLKAEQERGPDFLRLANALSALYPPGSEEKRLLDAMLLAMPK